ncbi:hypothetical protein [Urbifossiella limnaea]|uniref:Uncharacterized protein n=1 Tax=Urbifossiella limnaea TaxID=2528023 RepID=A0A517Y1I1_9BACT|nr:hypothetical protein [Urbifossiella limnaea]QDU23612.1 hypothetical protein ETAA1_56160 [Urbifossiella limnaea]
MGGRGSGNWWRWQSRKSTVEESLTLSLRDFRKSLYQTAAGALAWTSSSGARSSIGYVVTWNNDAPSITLSYRWRDAEDVRILVWLERTPTPFGGSRWWFTCPLVVRGVACNRRAGKLYLPPGSRYFGCRTCHDLTYRSAQEAHQDQRLLNHLGVALGADRETRRELLARLRG